MRTRMCLCVGLALLCLATSRAWAAPAAKPATQPAAEGVVVLDTAGFWRMHHTLKPPVIAMPDGPLKVRVGLAWAEEEGAPPPDDWTAADFDDANWFRGPARRSIRSPYLARLCLRGKFQVNDPAQVDGLSLTVGYHGGAIVYVNGREIARGQLPAGAIDRKAAMAEAYPKEAFVSEAGAPILAEEIRGWIFRPTEASTRKLALQERVLRDIAVPRDALRKGVNVVSVEVFRSPYDRVVEDKKGKRGLMTHPYVLAWNTCEISRIRLVARQGGGLVPAAARPPGLQAWNSDPMASDFDMDFGDRCEPLRPVRLVGAQNGAVSGKVVIGSDKPIQDLKATLGELKSPEGTIPPSAVRFRCAMPWGADHLVYPYSGDPLPYPAAAAAIGKLVDMPVAEVPVLKKGAAQGVLRLPGQPETVFGAVAPVWVTVQVPKDAKPGVYEGSFTIEARGESAVRVPIRLEVADWKIADPKDWRTWVEVVESPESLAMEYSLEMWSPKHMEMIGRSLDIIRQVGSGVVYVPLICRTHYGNDESMVRWVKKPLDKSAPGEIRRGELGAGGEDKYEFDFSTVDRYLNLVQKHLGTPKIVCLQVWDVYMIPLEQPTSKDVREDVRVRQHLGKNNALMGEGPAVTVVDPVSQKREMVYLPRYDEPNGALLWKPLFEQLRQRLAKRGLDKAMMLGLFPDVWATKGEVAGLKETSGDLPWVVQCHGGAPKDGIYGLSKCAYQSRVWLLQHPTEKTGSLHGWKRPELLAMFNRDLGFDELPNSVWRHYPEYAITGDQRGVARLGGEFWPVIRDKQGQRKGTATARFPESSWRNLDPWAALLAPGPDGPVASTRFEVFREGVQNCEARIVLEEALLDPAAKERLGEDLARRCEATLAERMTCMWRSRSTFLLSERYSMEHSFGYGIAGHIWFAASPWQDREKRLFSLAGEVSRKLGK